jgi:hypothetical protein
VRLDGRKIIDVRAVQAEVARRLGGDCHPEASASDVGESRDGSPFRDLEEEASHAAA